MLCLDSFHLSWLDSFPSRFVQVLLSSTIVSLSYGWEPRTLSTHRTSFCFVPSLCVWTCTCSSTFHRTTCLCRWRQVLHSLHPQFFALVSAPLVVMDGRWLPPFTNEGWFPWLIHPFFPLLHPRNHRGMLTWLWIHGIGKEMPICQEGTQPAPVGFQISSMIPSNRKHQRIPGGPRDRKVEEEGDGSVPTCNATQPNGRNERDEKGQRKRSKARETTMDILGMRAYQRERRA